MASPLSFAVRYESVPSSIISGDGVNDPSGDPSGGGHDHFTIGIGDVKIESDNT